MKKYLFIVILLKPGNCKKIIYIIIQYSLPLKVVINMKYKSIYNLMYFYGLIIKYYILLLCKYLY